MNGFGVEGAKAIGTALKSNRTLLELDLSHNRVPEEGATEIAQGMRENDVLQILKVNSIEGFDCAID